MAVEMVSSVLEVDMALVLETEVVSLELRTELHTCDR